MAVSKKKKKVAKRGRQGEGGGRPTALTPELQERICEYLRQGNYVETCAARVGLSKATLYRWLKTGSQEKLRVQRALDAGRNAVYAERFLPYVKFCDAVDAAEAEAEMNDLETIANASRLHWQAAAWRLERKSYKRWGRRASLEHSVGKNESGQPQTIKIGKKEIKF